MDSQEQTALDPHDGGYSSRKLWYAIGSSGAVIIGGVAAALWPAFRASYETYIGGLATILALYLGGNVGNKMVIAKSLATKVTNSIEKASAGAQAATKDASKDPSTPPVEPLPE